MGSSINGGGIEATILFCKTPVFFPPYMDSLNTGQYYLLVFFSLFEQPRQKKKFISP